MGLIVITLTLMNGFKVVIIGPTFVGKTSLLGAIGNKDFDPGVMSTTNTDVITKSYVFNSTEIVAVFWDTAGNEAYRSLSKQYFRGATCALAVFDLTQPATFDEMKSFIDEFQSECPESANNIIVLGNKYDLQRTSNEIAMSWCQAHGYPYFETSAKSRYGVEEAQYKLSEILSNVLNKAIHAEKDDDNQAVNLSDPKVDSPKNKCC